MCDCSQSARKSALAERIKTGDVDAEQKLVTANLLLVLKAVNDYTRRGVSDDDLIQEGNLGLIRAARHFDPMAHSSRFATYATYWIRCFMVRALATNNLSNEPTVCQNLGDLTEAECPATDIDCVRNEDRAPACAAIRRLSPFEAWVISERFGLGEPPGRAIRLAARPCEPAHEAENLANLTDPSGAASIDTGRGSESYFQRSYIEMGRECGLSAFRLHQVEKTALDKLRRALAERAPEGT